MRARRRDRIRSRYQDTRMKLWTWWRASSIGPDPAYMDRQALIDTVLFWQQQTEAYRERIAVLTEELERDDFLLGRPRRGE